MTAHHDPLAALARRLLDSRLLTAFVLLAVVALGFGVVADVTSVLSFFGDIILLFFLAWLLAFALRPLVLVVSRLPGLDQTRAAALVYVVLATSLVVLVVLVAGALAASISDFLRDAPNLAASLPTALAPYQRRLDGLGLSQVNLAREAGTVLGHASEYANALIGPFQQAAVASLGVLGSMLLMFMLSLYIAIDAERILAFLLDLVPERYEAEARLLQSAVGRSFGGFLRGQAVMGLVYAGVAALTSGLLGLGYLPVTTVAAGLLMAIPFFGPFVAFLPPVLVALLTAPAGLLPVLVLMLIGWFMVMNILSPRLMEAAVGIHPIVVLGSVLVGGKLAGISGAIFAIPVAAVLSAFFFYYRSLARDEMLGPEQPPAPEAPVFEP